jgi:hypothetical protein
VHPDRWHSKQANDPFRPSGRAERLRKVCANRRFGRLCGAEAENFFRFRVSFDLCPARRWRSASRVGDGVRSLCPCAQRLRKNFGKNAFFFSRVRPSPRFASALAARMRVVAGLPTPARVGKPAKFFLQKC